MQAPDNKKIKETLDTVKVSAVINAEKNGTIAIKTKSGRMQKIPTKFDEKLAPKVTDLSKVVLPGKNNAKIRKAFELCIKNDGDLSAAAEEAGYSPDVVENPKRLLKTKAWGVLINYYFPTYYLFEKEKELLNSSDNADIHKSLDRIHKLSGNFTRKVEVKINPLGEISQKSNEEIQQIIDGNVEIEDIEDDPLNQPEGEFDE